MHISGVYYAIVSESGSTETQGGSRVGAGFGGGNPGGGCGNMCGGRSF